MAGQEAIEIVDRRRHLITDFTVWHQQHRTYWCKKYSGKQSA